MAISTSWWVVCRRETRDLWVGGKALYLILIYSLLLGGYSYLLASNADTLLLPVPEMIQEMVRHSIAIAAFICLVAAEEVFAGGREGAMVVVLLMTAARRRIMVVRLF